MNVKKNHKVEYNSVNGNEFIVTKNDGSKKIFNQSKKGLYYIDTDENATNVVLLSTIDKNKSKYTSRDYNQAKLARKLQVLIGRPEIKDFIRYLDNSNIPNCPISRDDAIAAHNIFDKDIDGLQGKTTRKRRSTYGNRRSDSQWK